MMTPKEINDYKKSLKGKSKAELEALEQELIAEADELDKVISATEFDLPAENYDVACKAVRTLLNKQSVTWQYTLAMVGMYDFWADEKPSKIPYAQLDSLLHSVGELKFTGYDEWAMVVALNKYLEPITKEYQEITGKIYDIASKHSEVQNALGLNTPINSPVDIQ